MYLFIFSCRSAGSREPRLLRVTREIVSWLVTSSSYAKTGSYVYAVRSTADLKISRMRLLINKSNGRAYRLVIRFTPRPLSFSPYIARRLSKFLTTEMHKQRARDTRLHRAGVYNMQSLHRPPYRAVAFICNEGH